MDTVLIIGAGLAGTIIAKELRSKYKVILVDVGGHKVIKPELDPRSSKLASVPTFSYGLGGTSNLWHNGLISLNDEDLYNSEFREVIKKSDKYKSKAFNILTNNKIELDDLHRSYRKAGLENCSFSLDSIFYPKERYRLNSLEDIEFIGDIKRIKFKSVHNKITSVELIDDNNIMKLISFDKLVISSGGLNSPFVVNDVLDEIGLELRVDNKFIDHPMGFVGKVTIKKEFNDFFKKVANINHQAGEFKTCFRLKDAETKTVSCVYLRHAFSKKHSNTISKFKSKLGSASSFKERLKAAININILHPDIILEIIKHIFSVNIRTRTYSLMFVGSQLERTNTVNNVDNKLKISWSVSGDEKELYQRNIKQFIKLNQEYIESYSVDDDFAGNLWSAAHYSASVPIGKLVDSNLKLVGSDNVYVCDGSVITEHSYVNTGLTIGQLSLYLCNEVL